MFHATAFYKRTKKRKGMSQDKLAAPKEHSRVGVNPRNESISVRQTTKTLLLNGERLEVIQMKSLNLVNTSKKLIDQLSRAESIPYIIESPTSRLLLPEGPDIDAFESVRVEDSYKISNDKFQPHSNATSNITHTNKSLSILKLSKPQATSAHLDLLQKRNSIADIRRIIAFGSGQDLLYPAPIFSKGSSMNILSQSKHSMNQLYSEAREHYHPTEQKQMQNQLLSRKSIGRASITGWNFTLAMKRKKFMPLLSNTDNTINRLNVLMRFRNGVKKIMMQVSLLLLKITFR